ncbi:MAG TPA: ATP synthase F1 subunit delta [Nitriliruptorales bacterium]
MADSRTDAYARAAVAIAEGEGALDAVEDELLTVARTIDGNNELREQLTDIHLPAAQKLTFVESDALQAAHPATRAVLGMLIAGGRVGDVSVIAQRVAELAAASRQQELAEVYVAVALEPSQRDQLHRALEQVTGKSIDLKVHVDPSVVGGVRAKVGDTVIDGSIARRLSDIKSRLNA